MNALTDPAFYIGVATVFFSLLIALANRNTKKLFYDVACEIQTTGCEIKHEAKSRETETKIFVIDLHNPSWGIFSWLGGADIAPSDYQQRISVEFGESARILEAEIVEENPPGLGAEVTPYHYPPDTLVLKPLLLNQGDSLLLRVVVENPEQGRNLPWIEDCQVRVTGRIFGVKRIVREWDEIKWAWYGLLLGVSAVVVSVFRDLVSFVVGWLASGTEATPFPFNPFLPFADNSGTLPLYVFTFLLGIETSVLFVALSLFFKSKRKRRKQKKILQRYRNYLSRPSRT